MFSSTAVSLQYRTLLAARSFFIAVCKKTLLDRNCAFTSSLFVFVFSNVFRRDKYLKS
jgi:hypothetical protein